jgi:hypothetical protein
MKDRTEDRGQRTEDRGQRTEDRGRRTEDRGQRTEDRPVSIVAGKKCLCSVVPLSAPLSCVCRVFEQGISWKGRNCFSRSLYFYPHVVGLGLGFKAARLEV